MGYLDECEQHLQRIIAMSQSSTSSASGKNGERTGTRGTSSGYHQKALEEIHNSLLPFAKSHDSSAASTVSMLTTTSGISSASGLSSIASSYLNGNGLPQSGSVQQEREQVNVLRQTVNQLLSTGYTEDPSPRVLKHTLVTNGNRYDDSIAYLLKNQSANGTSNALNDGNVLTKGAVGLKLIRKPSLDREISSLHRGSPAMDSGAGSSRSDSPRLTQDMHPQLSRQYSPSGFGDPPPPPPRCTSTPPPALPPHAQYTQNANASPNAVPSTVQQRLKRMSPAPVVPSRAGAVPVSNQTRGTSPVTTATPNVTTSARQPMIVQNGPQAQQQLSQQIQALSLYQNGASTEPPPPYPNVLPYATPPHQNRQSPTQSQDYRKSPSSGIYSGSPSPITISCTTPTSMARPTPVSWGARQAKTQPPIIMQSVKSTQVQKPVLQTAIAPTTPHCNGNTTPPATYQNVGAAPTPPPSYASSIQHKQYSNKINGVSVPSSPVPVVGPGSITPVPTTEPPSYASTMQALAAQRTCAVLPPPPYGVDASTNDHSPLQRKYSPCVVKEEADKNYVQQAPPLPPSSSKSRTVKRNCLSTCANSKPATSPAPSGKETGDDGKKIQHQSPIPERKHISKEKEEQRRDCKVQNYSPQAFKFFMEQHIENVIKSYRQRECRRLQLEKEMVKINLSPEAQLQMRRMLSQKESNYIRLKRAKMDKTMFTKIKPIGVGAFGEVTLVRKIDTNHLYAMKTLRKADVLKRNQVAHVKAERDILAEADNEWVVKLYYSFQDNDNLYFVMDYIPGGDLMSLLIKLGIFEETLAKFYIAELTCAVESVHKMGFIHRDIKPDNILIDRDGHIKLTDFGLCTGFRWTHNSKYYQQNGEHARQDSMDPIDDWNGDKSECQCNHQLKPLERRRRREHQRCLAHSLVGTPNYIAPEVLQRTGYTQLCDWWSVGVILYEMLVGSPPFLANTPAETQMKVINWERTLQIPKQANLSPESTDLILKFCVSADKRLGKNANEVKAHAFFKSIDFDKGLRRQSAPYIPKIENATDTSNFDPIDPDKLRDSEASGSMDTGPAFHGFFEFTFRRFFDDGGLAFANRINLDEGAEASQGPVYV